MPAYFEFFSTHIMANIQVLVGFHFYIKLLQKSVRTYVYILIAALWLCITYLIPAGGMAEFLIYIFLNFFYFQLPLVIQNILLS